MIVTYTLVYTYVQAQCHSMVKRWKRIGLFFIKIVHLLLRRKLTLHSDTIVLILFRKIANKEKCNEWLNDKPFHFLSILLKSIVPFWKPFKIWIISAFPGKFHAKSKSIHHKWVVNFPYLLYKGKQTFLLGQVMRFPLSDILVFFIHAINYFYVQLVVCALIINSKVNSLIRHHFISRTAS